MKRVGVIGIGNMGRPMALNLLAQGYDVVVCDVSDDQVAPLIVKGAVRALSAREVADLVEVIVLSLPNIQAQQTVIAGAGGILESDDLSGKTIIDTTTSTMKVSAELAVRVAERGAWLLDSPVTGGVMGAEKATLSIMIGGDREAFERHRDVYDTLGGNIVYIGESGHGQISKLINQMLMGAIYCSVAECFGFATQVGVDVDKVFRAVEHGGAASGLLSGMKDYILAGEYGDGHYLAQHGKDIDYAMDEANRRHSFVPITAAVHEVWNLARLQGLSPASSMGMFGVWEKLLGKKMKDTIRQDV